MIKVADPKSFKSLIMMGMELSDVYLSFLPRLFKKIAKTDLGLLSIAEKSKAPGFSQKYKFLVTFSHLWPLI